MLLTLVHFEKLIHDVLVAEAFQFGVIPFNCILHTSDHVIVIFHYVDQLLYGRQNDLVFLAVLGCPGGILASAPKLGVKLVGHMVASHLFE